MNGRIVLVLMASASALAGGVAQAQAQTAPATTQNDASITDEIIVTAQNRAQSVQNVPIAISVISGEALRDKGITDFSSVQRVSPALQVTNDTNNTRVSVRGVGSLTNNEAQDQSIAVNIDGEYINRPTILNAAIFDLDRVEVLRGPQGTLYGRNSTGGAVNFIARKPGDTFGINATATYGNYNQVLLDGGVDVPLGDVGAIRVAGFYRSHDGYTTHSNTAFSPTAAYTPSTSTESDTDNTGGGRVSLRLKPAAGLTIDAAVEHVEQTLIPASQAWADMTSSTNNPGASTTSCANGWSAAYTVAGGVGCVPQNTNTLSKINRSNYDSPSVGVGSLHQLSTAARGRVAYNFGPATLTYTGGYRTTKTTGANTLSPNFVFTNFGGHVKTQSHELRLNGNTNGIEWQGGMFYFREKQDTNGGLYSPYIGANGSYVNYFRHPTVSESVSGFAQVEVPLAARLTAVGGARFTHDVRSANFTNYDFAFNSGPIELTTQPSTTTPLHYSGSKFTWLAGLNYKLDADTLLYAKVSTGYKAGGFDGSGKTFNPESNTAYEGGAKLRFAGNNTLNVAGFYYDYKDLQNDVLLDAAIGAQTFNAGSATIYGVEVEANLHPTRADTVTLALNLMHATYDKFEASVAAYTNGVVPTTPVTVDLAGNRLPQAPNAIVSVGWDHVFDLGGSGTITASAFSRYKGNYYLDFYNYQDSKQIGHTQSDFSLEYKPANKHYSVQAFVRNIENYRLLAYAGNTVVTGVANTYNWQFTPPRTYGVRLGIDF